MNDLGGVNAYAKDIAQLPMWQQRIWHGYNITPDGPPAAELLMSQGNATPANTVAPEVALLSALEQVEASSTWVLGASILTEHAALPEILRRIHRFRANDAQGLFALAKDLARVTADTFDRTRVQAHLSLSGEEKKYKTLKSVELLVSRASGATEAHGIMAPLFGVYDLRLADAHLPSATLDAAFVAIGVDRSLPLVIQAKEMIGAVAVALFAIARHIEHFPED